MGRYLTEIYDITCISCKETKEDYLFGSYSMATRKGFCNECYKIYSLSELNQIEKDGRYIGEQMTFC